MIQNSDPGNRTPQNDHTSRTPQNDPASCTPQNDHTSRTPQNDPANRTTQNDLSIRDAQGVVDEWIRSIGKGYFSELTNMVILTEEVGELARVIARTYGDQVAKAGDLRKSLKEELADVLWVLICLANQTGVDLTEALQSSLAKKTSRDSDRFNSRDIK